MNSVNKYKDTKLEVLRRMYKMEKKPRFRDAGIPGNFYVRIPAKYLKNNPDTPDFLKNNPKDQEFLVDFKYFQPVWLCKAEKVGVSICY